MEIPNLNNFNIEEIEKQIAKDEERFNDPNSWEGKPKSKLPDDIKNECWDIDVEPEFNVWRFWHSELKEKLGIEKPGLTIGELVDQYNCLPFALNRQKRVWERMWPTAGGEYNRENPELSTMRIYMGAAGTEGCDSYTLNALNGCVRFRFDPNTVYRSEVKPEEFSKKQPIILIGIIFFIMALLMALTLVSK